MFEFSFLSSDAFSDKLCLHLSEHDLGIGRPDMRDFECDSSHLVWVFKGHLKYFQL